MMFSTVIMYQLNKWGVMVYDTGTRKPITLFRCANEVKAKQLSDFINDMGDHGEIESIQYWS